MAEQVDFQLFPPCCFSASANTFFLRRSSTGGRSADRLTQHLCVSASVFTTWHKGCSLFFCYYSGAEISKKRVKHFSCAYLGLNWKALTFKAVALWVTSYLCMLLNANWFSAAVHTFSCLFFCRVCGLICTFTAAVKWNRFRCGLTWEPLDFYLCNHRMVTPTWTSPGNKEATERREKESLWSLPTPTFAVMNLIRS